MKKTGIFHKKVLTITDMSDILYIEIREKEKRKMKNQQFSYATEYYPTDRELEKMEAGRRVMAGSNEVFLFCQTDSEKTYAYNSRRGNILCVDDNIRELVEQVAEEFELDEVQDWYVNSPFRYYRVDVSQKQKINRRLKKLIKMRQEK